MKQYMKQQLDREKAWKKDLQLDFLSLQTEATKRPRYVHLHSTYKAASSDNFPVLKQTSRLEDNHEVTSLCKTKQDKYQPVLSGVFRL